MINGAGLGLRRSMLDEIERYGPVPVDFWELTPENWMALGGRYQDDLLSIAEQYPLTAHGLSLSIGSPDPLDTQFVSDIKAFLAAFHIPLYSEHLSYCSAGGHMYDLMPIPFTEQAICHVVERIQLVQDILRRPLVIENVSYYAAPGQEMSELEFTTAVLKRSGCQLLLDVNNVFVNATNHNYDARSFIRGLPSERVVYGHIAGHYDEAQDLLVDTHGNDVKPAVWELLDFAYQCHGVFPTLLERDFNIPPLDELLRDVERIRQIQAPYHAVRQGTHG